MEWFLKPTLSASDTLKHWSWFKGEEETDKDWDGADSGMSGIKEGDGAQKLQGIWSWYQTYQTQDF